MGRDGLRLNSLVILHAHLWDVVWKLKVGRRAGPHATGCASSASNSRWMSCPNQALVRAFFLPKHMLHGQYKYKSQNCLHQGSPVGDNCATVQCNSHVLADLKELWRLFDACRLEFANDAAPASCLGYCVYHLSHSMPQSCYHGGYQQPLNTLL